MTATLPQSQHNISDHHSLLPTQHHARGPHRTHSSARSRTALRRKGGSVQQQHPEHAGHAAIQVGPGCPEIGSKPCAAIIPGERPLQGAHAEYVRTVHDRYGVPSSALLLQTTLISISTCCMCQTNLKSAVPKMQLYVKLFVAG